VLESPYRWLFEARVRAGRFRVAFAKTNTTTIKKNAAAICPVASFSREENINEMANA
jgi:hypothetical protein